MFFTHAEFVPGAIHSEWCHSDVKTWLNITYLDTQEGFKSYFLQNQDTFIILHTSLGIKNDFLYKAKAIFIEILSYKRHFQMSSLFCGRRYSFAGRHFELLKTKVNERHQTRFCITTVYRLKLSVKYVGLILRNGNTKVFTGVGYF